MQRYSAGGGASLRRPSLRQRFGALGLTILIELALLLLVLAFGGRPIRNEVAPAVTTSIIFVPNPTEPAASKQSRQDQRKAAAPNAPRPPRPVPTPPAPRDPLPFVPMSKVDLAASDISKLGSAAGAVGLADTASAGPGEGRGDGPGGVQLFNAEWVVEPTNAQLRPYLPAEVAPGSWALIACQTIAHNHVENCAQMGEGPRGSGLSKAMRLAAWQFLVRPPRIGGKPMVGAWVRIRIDFDKPKGED